MGPGGGAGGKGASILIVSKEVNSNLQISFSLNQVTGTIWFNYKHANTCVSKYLKFKLSGSTPAGISELKKLKGGQQLTRVLTASVNLKTNCDYRDMNNVTPGTTWCYMLPVNTRFAKYFAIRRSP